jgi:hypothetical protein
METKLSQSVKDFVRQALMDLEPELDLKHCLENKVQFKNDEVPANEVAVITRESMRAAYAFLRPTEEA